MWHILEDYNRRVARRVTAEFAEYLLQKIGGRLEKSHLPKEWGELGSPIDAGGLVGYISNAKTLYTYPLIEIEADGQHVATVTRKKDAFSIMQALKRDYKEIRVKIKEVVND